MKAERKTSPKWHGMQKPDAIGAPYGDLMGDDAALETFCETREKMRSIRKCLGWETGNRKYMTKAKFADWKASLFVDDDKPLRAYGI